ncbi:MAG TPA: hypothetical protein VFH87_03575 [Candidatus Udaeobacter sp.]|jgi:hypothetical protein|nr:hypothetical protein [Candidatus Udaeobacter sp.]
MSKRVCYLHIGPHKTGTTSIQWFLKENRAVLLKRGYFVPESGNIHGGHHPLVRRLCGQPVPPHQRDTAARFARAIKDTFCEAVVISSEALDGLLVNRDCARQFFGRMEELNLEPKLVFFPRNQSQLMNSRYTEVTMALHRSESFETFVQAEIRHPSFRYSHLIALADAFNLKLIAKPFTQETITRGVVPEFLRAIEIDPLPFQDTNVRRNQGAGPFSISVARDVLRLLGSEGRRLTWAQASRCGKKLTAYLDKKSWADSGYCGLTTALARHIETEWRPDNDAFAQKAWGGSWAEVFAAEVGREFKPNDFEICPPGSAVSRRLRRAVREMNTMVEEILLDPALAIKAPWNDLRKRNSGFPENKSSG